MNREETLALLAKGKDAWNAWAAEKQSERDALERSGQWQTTAERQSVADVLEWQTIRGEERTHRALTIKSVLKGANDATQHWLWEANASFSTPNDSTEFDRVDVSGFIFPGSSQFDGATF